MGITGGAAVAVHAGLVTSPSLGPVKTLKSCPHVLYIGSKSCSSVSVARVLVPLAAHRYSQEQRRYQPHNHLAQLSVRQSAAGQGNALGMGILELEPKLRRLVLQSPPPPARSCDCLKSYVEGADTDAVPFPYVFLQASSWFGGARPIVPGWTGVATDSRAGAMVLVQLLQIQLRWEEAQGASIQIAFGHLGEMLRLLHELQGMPGLDSLREAGCLFLDPSWMKHVKACYDNLAVRISAPKPSGDLELLVVAGRSWQHSNEAGMHPKPSVARHLFDYHLLAFLMTHGKAVPCLVPPSPTGA